MYVGRDGVAQIERQTDAKRRHVERRADRLRRGKEADGRHWVDLRQLHELPFSIEAPAVVRAHEVPVFLAAGLRLAGPTVASTPLHRAT